MYLNEQLLDLTAAAVFFVLAVILLAVLQWRGDRQIERREEALRLAGVALVNSLEHLLAQNARDIERRSTMSIYQQLQSEATRLRVTAQTAPRYGPDPLAEFASERDIHGANLVDREIMGAYTVADPQGYDAYGKPITGGWVR